MRINALFQVVLGQEFLNEFDMSILMKTR